ncbi:MAG: lipoyl(octanoyl) transferase LipB [Synergistaceae bacterium]|jgi:lipoate-protein ligase B|nr:lipoyl(octanoyl) transferase LipB [Synergistaceae bacterium]
MDTVDWLDLGEIGYDEALDIQLSLHGKCWRGLRRDIVIFQRNEPLITCGVDSDRDHILWGDSLLREAGIAVREVQRGGGVTYHGPGQIIVSPLLRFTRYCRTAHLYLRALEEVMIRLLGRFGVNAERVCGKSGVFVCCGADGRRDKIASAGLSVSHGVTMHGMSLNIDPDMRHFEAIVACGLYESGVTSLAALGCAVSYGQARDAWLEEFAGVFGVGVARAGFPASTISDCKG